MAIEHVLIKVTCGPENASKCTRAFQFAKLYHLLNTVSVTIFLVDDAVYLSNVSLASKIKAPTGDNLIDHINYLNEHNVQILMCKPCSITREIDVENLLPNWTLVGGDKFVELSIQDNTHVLIY